MNTTKKGFLKYAQSEHLMPQTEMLETKRQRAKFSIGVPREIAFQENRIALVPEAIGVLINNGHQVFVESNAGKSAHFPDHEYSEAGAQIVFSPEEIFKTDIIFKVAPPLLSEIEMLKPRSSIFSALNLPGQNNEYFKRLSAKKITALSYEHIKDRTNGYPVIRSLSEIVGTTAISLAAEYLSSIEYGKGKILGGFSGITPAEVVIIGAGTVGEFAARTALGMGALVKIFDDNIFKLRSIQNKLNQRLFTSVIQQKVLIKALRSADVVIGALHSPSGSIPCVITEDMVREMPNGSVLIDVSIAQGGCIETSRCTNHTHPVFKKHGVTHYCVPNIASKVPHTASYALSNFFAPIISRIGEEGSLSNLLKSDSGVRAGVYIYNGILTNEYISKTYNIPFQDIELLMAAFH
ncbi:MAG: alanine dehydrogenase [Bacteroidota bacterium]